MTSGKLGAEIEPGDEMMDYSQHILKFKQALDGRADLAFLPISADLQYLAGVNREMPTFGAIRHPGGWVEGLWLAPDADPLLILTRMTAEFNNPGGEVQVRVLGEFEDPASLLKEVAETLKLAEVKTAAMGDKTSGETFIQVQSVFPGVEFVSASELLAPQRMIKSDEELELMRQAGRITEAAFGAAVKRMRHGMTELDVIQEVDYQLRAWGGFGPSFNTTLYVVGPEHELLFSQQEVTWPRVLTPPVSILFDMGAVYEGYCYDYGRTVFFGEPDKGVKLAHRLVMESQAAGMAAMRAGSATAEDADRAARAVIEKAGMGETFRHRLGHGIGLDVHEPPFLTEGDQSALQEGMLFTVEPSVLVSFAGSARVEDVVLVGEDGGVPLTSGYRGLIVVS
jgi:Xaa-Pro dipeptidase